MKKQSIKRTVLIKMAAVTEEKLKHVVEGLDKVAVLIEKITKESSEQEQLLKQLVGQFELE